MPLTKAVEKLKFKDPDKKQELVDYIIAEIDAAKAARSELEGKWRTWLWQYEGRLMYEEHSGGKPSWRARLDVPLTREKAQHARSRLVNNIVQEDPIYTGKARHPDYYETAVQVERFLDSVIDPMEFEKLIDGFVLNAQIYSLGVIKVPWVVETKKMRYYQTVEPELTGYSEEEGEEFLSPEALEPEVEEVEEEQESFVGVRPEIVNTEDFLFPYESLDVQSAPWVAQRVRYSRLQIEELIDKGVFDDILDELTVKTDHGDDEAKTDRDKVLNVEAYDREFYDCWEVYLNYDIDDDKRGEELIVVIEEETGKVLRAIKNFYHDFVRPYVVWQWEPRPNTMYGVSFCQIIEPIHRAVSASVCQRLDAATIANTINWGVQAGSLVAKKFANRELPLGEVVELDDTSQFTEIKLGNAFSQLESLEQMLTAHADKIVGITDYMQGIETINRPTATGQQMLIEEGKQPLYAKLASLRSILSVFANMVIARYRQFYPDGVPYNDLRTQSEEQAILSLPKELIDDKILVEIKASSQSFNKATRRQEVLGLLDRMTQCYGVVAQYAIQGFQLAMQMPQAAELVGKIVDAYVVMMKRFLAEFEAGNVEEIWPDFGVGQLLQQAAQQAQQQQQAAGPAGAGGPPGPGGPPGEGGPPGGGRPPGGGGGGIEQMLQGLMGGGGMPPGGG